MIRKKAASKSTRKSSTRKRVKTAARRTAARASTGRRRARKGAAGNSPHAPAIQGWPTDPMGGVPPLQLAVPTLPGFRFPRASSLRHGRPEHRSIHWGRTGSATGPRVRHFVDPQPSGQRQVQGAGIGISERRSRFGWTTVWISTRTTHETTFRQRISSKASRSFTIRPRCDQRPTGHGVFR